MKKHLSQFAKAHVASVRQRKRRADWGDVAEAYDAGMTHVLAMPTSKRMKLDHYMRALRVMEHWAGETP